MINIDELNFDLPEGQIAKAPAEPRDSSRLFVYDSRTGTITYDIFRNLATHLSPSDFLVFNDTKVVPARATLKKETGGKVVLLFLANEKSPHAGTYKALSDRKIVPGQKLFFDESHGLEVVGQDENIFYIKPLFNEKLSDMLFKHGTMPIPKYIGDTGLSEARLRERYQTVFAQSAASVAAPTASLHFTRNLLEELPRAGIESAYVTLDVGMGTFAPVTALNFQMKELHREAFRISPRAACEIASAKKKGKSIVAVGTTAMRTLESAADRVRLGEGVDGETTAFFFDPHDFKVCDKLITNFHLPKSSLLCLVDAFLKWKGAKHSIVELYERAIKDGFRFYSFGDSMLIK